MALLNTDLYNISFTLALNKMNLFEKQNIFENFAKYYYYFFFIFK